MKKRWKRHLATGLLTVMIVAGGGKMSMLTASADPQEPPEQIEVSQQEEHQTPWADSDIQS